MVCTGPVGKREEVYNFLSDGVDAIGWDDRRVGRVQELPCATLTAGGVGVEKIDTGATDFDR